jgi:PAS domain S-box-containing protein
MTEKDRMIVRNLWFGFGLSFVGFILSLAYASVALFIIGAINFTFSVICLMILFRGRFYQAFELQLIYFTLLTLIAPFFSGWSYAGPVIIMSFFASMLFIFDNHSFRIKIYTYFFLVVLGLYLTFPLLITFPIYSWQRAIDYIAILIGYSITLSSLMSYRKYNREAKKEIYESHGILNSLLRSTNDPIWAFGANGDLIACNKAAKDNFLRCFKIVVKVGDKLFEKLNGDVFEKYRYYFEESLKGKIFEIESQIEVDGKIEYFKSRFAPIISREEEIIGVSVFSKNITKVQEAYNALEESESKYRLIAQNTTDIIALHNTDGSFYFVSPICEQVTGFTPDDLVGKHPSQFLHPDDQYSAIDIFNNVLEYGGVIRVTFRFKTKKDDWVWLESAMGRVTDASGAIKYIQITSRNVTKTIQIQHIMEQRNQIINKLIHLQPVVYYRFKKDGEILESVGQGLGKLGLKKNQLVGQNIFKLYTKYPEVIRSHRKVLTSLFVSYNTAIEVSPDEFIYYDTKLSYDPVLGEGAGLSFDISEQREVLNQLKESEARFRKFFEYSPFGVAIRDLKTGKFVAVNDKMVKMTGYSRPEIIGTFREGMTAWEDVKNYNEQLDSLIKGELESFQNQKLFLRKDGSSFWGRVHRTSFTIEGRHYIVGFLENIDEELEAKQLLVESEKQYRLLFENAFDGLIIFDKDASRPIECNSRTLQYFKFESKEALLNTSALDLSLPTQPNGQSSSILLKQHIQEALTKGETNYEWQYYLKDGTILYTEVSILEIQLSSQRRFIGIFKDITEKKRHERLLESQMVELNEKNTKLQEYIDSNMQLENFAYMASHDMKAPLRTIISFSQLLQRRTKGKLGSKEMDYLRFIIKATKSLYSLINGLLTFSKVDASKAFIEEINLRELVHNSLKELHTTIEEKEALVYVKNLPERLHCDKVQMKQLIQNLISNALKFSRADVRPEVLIEGKDLGESWEIKIEDNGIGIDPKYHDRIFLLFRRLHTNDEIEGTGIGLALCKKIIDQHNGSIQLESNVGNGTSFYIQLPKYQLSDIREIV